MYKIKRLSFNYKILLEDVTKNIHDPRLERKTKSLEVNTPEDLVFM